MTTTTSRKRVLALGLLAPLALSIAACESDTTIAIGEEGNATLIMEIRDTEGFLEMGGVTSCNDFAEDMAEDSDEYTIEDISTGDMMACRITLESYDSAIDGHTLRETDNTYIFEIPAEEAEDEFGSDDVDMLADAGFGFTFTVEMPGDIVTADGAKINGNRATYDDPTSLMNGIYVEGQKTSDGSTSAPTSDEATAEATDPASEETTGAVAIPDDAESDVDGGGVPTWAWVLIAWAALAAIGGIISAVTRKKDNGYGGPGGYPDGRGDYPGGPHHGGPGYGQAPYGQPGQDTQQFAPSHQPGEQIGNQAYGVSGYPAPRTPGSYEAAPNVPQSGSARDSYSQGGAHGGYSTDQATPGGANFSRGGSEGGLGQTGEFPIPDQNPEQMS